MKRFMWFALFCSTCWGDLPALPQGHWYSRVVDVEKGTITYYDTYFTVANNIVSAKRSPVGSKSLPAGYKPGDLASSLPALPNGHKYIEQEENGVKTIWEGYTVYDSYGIRYERSAILLEEPVKKEMPVKPDVSLAPASPTAREELSTPPPPPKVSTNKPSSRSKLRPPSELGSGPIVSETDEEGRFSPLLAIEKSKALSAEKTDSGPERLLRHLPEAAISVDWSEGSRALAEKQRNKAIELLRSTEAESSRWQFDLSKRFLTCADGKCQVRDRGHGKVEVPFQVGLGRVWVLSIESERLAYALQNSSLSSEQEHSELLQMVRRLESMETYLKFSHGESKSNYQEKLEQNLKALRALTKSWNVFETDKIKARVLRWQILSKDMQVFSERARSLKSDLNEEPEVLLLANELDALQKKLSQSPWEKDEELQYEIARTIYFDASAPLREKYRALARTADGLRERPDSYINMLVMLGAAENIAVYSWAIMEDLANESDPSPKN